MDSRAGARYRPVPPPPSEKFHEAYIRKKAQCLSVAAWILVALGIALLVLIAIAGVGASNTVGTMEEMRSATGYMKQTMNDTQVAIENYARDLMADYPDNQDKIVMSQVMGTVQNVHRISSRVYDLLAMTGEQQMNALFIQMEQISENVNAKLASVSVEQIEAVFATVDSVRGIVASVESSGLIANVNTLISSVPPEEITELIRKLSTVVGGLSAQDVSDLVHGVQDLVQHADRIAEEVESDELVGKVDNLVNAVNSILDHLQATREVKLNF